MEESDEREISPLYDSTSYHNTPGSWEGSEDFYYRYGPSCSVCHHECSPPRVYPSDGHCEEEDMPGNRHFRNVKQDLQAESGYDIAQLDYIARNIISRRPNLCLIPHSGPIMVGTRRVHATDRLLILWPEDNNKQAYDAYYAQLSKFLEKYCSFPVCDPRALLEDGRPLTRYLPSVESACAATARDYLSVQTSRVPPAITSALQELEKYIRYKKIGLDRGIVPKPGIMHRIEQLVLDRQLSLSWEVVSAMRQECDAYTNIVLIDDDKEGHTGTLGWKVPIDEKQVPWDPDSRSATNIQITRGQLFEWA